LSTITPAAVSIVTLVLHINRETVLQQRTSMPVVLTVKSSSLEMLLDIGARACDVVGQINYR
jgi:hypothetical protein